MVIDGLDECETVERKQLLEFIVDIVAQCDIIEPGKLRVLIVSQDFADIKRALSPPGGRVLPEIVSMSPTDTEDDIRMYTYIWAEQIAAKFDLDEETKCHLQNLTARRANGMCK